MTLARRITSTIMLAAFVAAGAIYSFPAQIFPQLFAAEVDFAQIYLNPNSALTEVNGAVTLNGMSAKNGDIVKTGDIIATSATGSANIIYFEDSVTRLAPNTTFEILTLKNATENPLATEIRGAVKTGSAWSKTVRAMDPGAVFAVETATTVATIRGSAFAVSVAPNGTTSVTSAEHGLQLDLRNDADSAPTESVTVAEGEIAILLPSPALATEPTDPAAPIKIPRPRMLKTTTPAAILNADWYRKNMVADEQHIKKVEQKVMTREKAAFKIQPDSPLYFLQERADARRIENAPDEISRKKAEVASMRRTVLAAEITNASPTKRADLLAVFAAKTENPADLALLEKAHASARTDEPDYAVKQTLMQLRVETTADPEQRMEMAERAERVGTLDVQDATKAMAANPEPAKTHEVKEIRDNLKIEMQELKKLDDNSEQPTITRTPKNVERKAEQQDAAHDAHQANFESEKGAANTNEQLTKPEANNIRKHEASRQSEKDTQINQVTEKPALKILPKTQPKQASEPLQSSLLKTEEIDSRRDTKDIQTERETEKSEIKVDQPAAANKTDNREPHASEEPTKTVPKTEVPAVAPDESNNQNTAEPMQQTETETSQPTTVNSTIHSDTNEAKEPNKTVEKTSRSDDDKNQKHPERANGHKKEKPTINEKD